MAAPVFSAVNRHVHSAFWVKHACAALTYTCYETALPPEMGYMKNIAWSGEGVGGDSYPCVQSVLDHEKFNIAEGYYFQNLSLTLLSTGPSFCQRPDLGAQLEVMARQLNEVQAYHSSSMLFDELVDHAFTQVRRITRAQSRHRVTQPQSHPSLSCCEAAHPQRHLLSAPRRDLTR